MTRLIFYRDFASNVGIAYKSPEEYFLDEEPRPFARTFDPFPFIDNDLTGSVSSSKTPLFDKRNPLDIVLFCGSPGAGKSTFYWQVLEPLGYERVNQDILKTVSYSAFGQAYALKENRSARNA